LVRRGGGGAPRSALRAWARTQPGTERGAHPHYAADLGCGRVDGLLRVAHDLDRVLVGACQIKSIQKMKLVRKMSPSSENTRTGLDSPPAGRLISSVMTRFDKSESWPPPPYCCPYPCPYCTLTRDSTSESWRESRPQGDGSGQPASAARGAGRGTRGAGRGHPAARRI